MAPSRFSVGLRPKVADDQLEGIEQALLEGALAHGFATDVWALERIAVVIQGLTGMGLSSPSVWRLLRNRLGWTVQRPQRRPRNVTRRRSSAGSSRTGRGSKRARAKSAWLVFFDESGISLIPPVRRTWARRGHTEILRHRMAWKRASMAAALGYRPDGTKARLCFHLQPDSYDPDSLIGVLEQRNGFYAGHQVVLLWDGLSAHWSHKMRTHLAAQRAWLSVERLPAYAPDLNPVEYLWANLKGTELANFTGDTIAEVADQAHHGIQRVCDSDSLIVGFLAHTSLSLDDDPSPSSERINRDQFRMRLGGCLRCPPDGAIWGVWKCRMAVARL